MKIENIKLYNGDCLAIMDKLIEQGVKVDAIITDLPYGTTACKWDSVIPFNMMWDRLNKLTESNIILFGSQPFTSELIHSNLKMFKYEIIWEKNIAANFCFAKYGIMKFHENIMLFNSKKTTYNPQMTLGEPNHAVGKGKRNTENLVSMKNSFTVTNKTDGLKHPKSVLKFNREVGLHPTQKPVALLEYLIKTYTNEGDIVLDFTMGSGSTGVACVNTNRKFIGIELDDTYFEIAKNRIEETLKNQGLQNEKCL